MIRIAHCVFLVVLLAASGQPQQTLTFCDLVRNPEKYNGKYVTVRATYRYGFEWQELYCLDCLDKGKAWLEIADDLDKPSEKALKKAPKYAGIVNVSVTGTFQSGRTFGHQNGYRYQFIAHEIRDVAVVYKGVDGEKEEAAEKKWACGGEKAR